MYEIVEPDSASQAGHPSPPPDDLFGLEGVVLVCALNQGGEVRHFVCQNSRDTKEFFGLYTSGRARDIRWYVSSSEIVPV